MTCGVVCLRVGTLVAFCCLFIMLFLCFALGGVGVSGEIICSLVSDWLGMGGVMLTRTGCATVMGGAVGATMMGGVITLGKDGATLGGETIFFCCRCGNLLLWLESGSLKNSGQLL